MADAHELVGRLVLEDRVLPGRLRISDGMIASLEPDESAASGPYIAPGFIDVHVHGWGGHDAMDGAAALTGMARALARRGVTSFLPTAVSATLEALARFADDVRAWMPAAPGDGAQPLGFDLEGPFLNPERKGAHRAEHLRRPADVPEEALAPLLDRLRLVTIAPELPGATELIARLAAAGIAVSLGHSQATAAQARAGYAAGARSTTHLFNAMTGLGHRDPGLALAALLDDDVWTELIADRHHVDPALWPLIARLKPRGKVVLVSDALAMAGTDATTGTIGGQHVRVDAGRVALIGTDTIAGSVLALDTAVRHLVADGAGLPDAVMAASTAPARLLGLRDRGRLAPGLRADVVELDADLAPRRVMIAGASIGGVE